MSNTTPSVAADLEREQQRRPSLWSGVWGSQQQLVEPAVRASHTEGDNLWVTSEKGGRLPSLAGDQKGGAVFDGLLYNHDELARELGIPATKNNAEVVLEVYRKWGNDGLSKIRGIFAIVIQDGQRVLFMRDALGVYPLFFDLQRMLFGTSIAEMLRQPNANRAINIPALANHLRHYWPDPAETFYESVLRVIQGHVVVVEQNKIVNIFRHWDPAPPGQEMDWLSESELYRFDEVLDRAVQRYLELGNPALFLSGGLDSVTVGAAAIQLSQKMGLPIPWALSLVFPDPECNEENVQRSVARQLGMPLFITSFDEAAGDDGLFPAALKLSSELDLPLLNTWLPTYTHLGARGVERDCDVILTGNGGDEWLSVGPFYAADLLLKGDFKGLWRLTNNVGRSYRNSRLDTLRGTFWTFGMRPIVTRTIRRAVNVVAPEYIAGRKRHQLAQRTPEWLAPKAGLRDKMDGRLKSIPEVPELESFYLREMRVALDHILIAWDMEEVFQVSRQIGARILHPLWDADLVDLLYRIPPELLNRGGRSKGMVRESLARRFPDLGFDRQKKVTSTNYFQTIMIDQGKKAWDMMKGTPALADAGIVDPVALKSTFFNILEDPEQRRLAHRVWDVLNIEAWVQSHA